MLIFGMGLYGLFISNVSPDVPSSIDRAIKGSSLFGMFALKVILLPLEQNCSLYNSLASTLSASAWIIITHSLVYWPILAPVLHSFGCMLFLIKLACYL